jgi:hypothetical protein
MKENTIFLALDQIADQFKFPVEHHENTFYNNVTIRTCSFVLKPIPQRIISWRILQF